MRSELLGTVRRWFDLAEDQAPASEIDASIRAGVHFRGTNLWILICATFVASIGLNVNSAAVIIGAMLISPLMGPIMGIGYAAAINDTLLLKAAARSLSMAVVFSLLTSTVYFLMSPLSEARSEILARTSPAIWDVLIAVFGGLAGIIGSTRQQKSNVIPGVAIATALMPPLCTAGYGIATGQPYYTLGALYLFTINSVFIATATLVMVRVMDIPEVKIVEETARQRARRLMAAVVFLTGIPSVYLAYGLVQQELFTVRAERFIAASFPAERGVVVVGKRVDPSSRQLEVTVIGQSLSEEVIATLRSSLPNFGLAGAELDLIQSRQEAVDVGSLRQQVAADLYRDTLVALDEKNREIGVLEEDLESAIAARQQFLDVGAELQASYPQIVDLGVGRGPYWAAGEPSGEAILVTATVSAPLSEEERARLVAWLKVRTKLEEVHLFVRTE